MENIVLYGPNGASPINLGSWLQADPGPDYGARGLIQAVETESFADGGQFVYDRAGIRKMAFPLMPASGGAGLSLTQLESLIHFNARPGGWVDIQPDGVGSSEAVRFDLVHGRWEAAHSIYMNRAARRPGTLYLDTQPFGYWPTWITLASTASMMTPGQIMLSAASIIGDAPALVRMSIAPGADAVALPSTFDVGNTYFTDFIAWAIGGGPSLPTCLAIASWNGPLGAPFAGGATTPDNAASSIFGTGQVWRSIMRASAMRDTFGIPVFTSPTTALVRSANYTYPLDNRFQGRFRLYGWFRQFGGSGVPYQMIADVGHDLTPLASANPVATLVDTASVPRFNGSGPQNAYFQLADFGELSIPNPPERAGQPSWTDLLRVWLAMPSSAATVTLDFAGGFLLPVDGCVGYVPNGMRVGSVGQVTNGLSRGLTVNALSGEVTLTSNTSLDPSDESGYPGRHLYYGGLPYVGASDTFLSVVAETRPYQLDTFSVPTLASSMVLRMRGGRSGPQKAAVHYRPRFKFLKGL